MREYNIDYNDPVQAAITTINMHRDTLISLRKRTAKPEELEWEIRLYDYMLKEPVARLDAYYKARIPKFGKPPIEKRKVVKKLGWVIP